MIDALSLPFMQRALVAGLLIGVIASYYGVFLVQRQLSFLGVGLSHAAFGGVALGLLVGIEPLWVAAPFTVLVALGINAVTERGTLAGDTAIGVFFAVAIAIGIILLAYQRSYTTDAFAYLFGSILAVQPSDLWLIGGLALVTSLTTPLWGRWAYASFDRDLAEADQVPVRRDNYVLAALLAVAIVAAVKIVGVLLVAAFFVIPAAAARLLVSTFRGMTLAAVGVGVVSAVGGLLLSYQLDVPSGATIVLTQALFFAGALLIAKT